MQWGQVRVLRRKLRKVPRVLPPPSSSGADNDATETQAEVEAEVRVDQGMLDDARATAEQNKADALVRCACTAVASATAEVISDLEEQHEQRMREIEKRVHEKHQEDLRALRASARQAAAIPATIANTLDAPCPACMSFELTVRTVESQNDDGKVYSVMICVSCGYSSDPQVIDAPVVADANATGPSCGTSEAVNPHGYARVVPDRPSAKLPPLRSPRATSAAMALTSPTSSSLFAHGNADPFAKWLAAERQREVAEKAMIGTLSLPDYDSDERGNADR